MKDFKSTEKTVCFKEGGQVAYKPRKQYKDDSDISQDKAIVKKGVSQHEAKLHKGEPKTELKLRSGGRAKKEGGCVGRYKTGGTVENQYADKKTKKDIKDIANTKRQKPKMLADGGGVFDTLKNNVLGTPEQNAAAAQRNDKYIKAKMAQKAAGQKLGGAEEMALKMGQMGQKADAMTGMGAVTDAERAMIPARKRGGKMCK
jgi:hypothetical protein